jgi:hypothetical protein
MSDEGIETFEVSEREEPQMRETSEPRKRFLHITIVDHNPVIEGTDEQSYINLKIPLDMADAGLRMVPDAKWGSIDPDLIVSMIEGGVEGEVINIKENKRSVTVRVE